MSAFGVGGVLIAFAALVVAAHAALHRGAGSAREGLLQRVAGSILVALAAPIAMVVVLGAVGLVRPVAVASVSFCLAFATVVLAGRDARRRTLRDGVRLTATVRSAMFGGTWSACAWVAAVAVLLATVATWALPVWAWDALGYHLPLVHDALQVERLRVVPTHIPYVNGYPHLADLYFVWWRALLPDDTWIELAQLPFALYAVVAVAAMVERAGVHAGRALAVCATFLAVPAVALQLAANYVDVAYAAFLMGAVAFLFRRPPSHRGDALGALSLGLFLGTKPSAPVPFALIVVALVLHRRALTTPARVVAGAALIGGLKYVENLVRYGNPVWPVRMRIGPVTLPGLESASYFFDLGLEQPYRAHGWLGRLVASLYALPTRFTYDMRVGGFGPLVGFVLIPIGLWIALRRRRALAGAGAAIVVMIVASLATPAAFWTRYTLPLAGALLALVAIGTRRSSPRVRNVTELTIGAAAAIGLVRATPGFTDSRVSLAELVLLESEDARAARFGGVDGREADWIAARLRVEPGESLAYDRSLGLPGRLWNGRGATRLIYLGDLPPRSLAETLRHERVRIAALSASSAEAARREGFALEELFRCRDDACTVYVIGR